MFFSEPKKFLKDHPLFLDLFYKRFLGGGPLSSSSSDVDVSVSDSDVIAASAESASAKTPISSSAVRDLRFDVFTEAILKNKVCTCFLNFIRPESINPLQQNLENDLKVYFRGQTFYILEAKALKKTIQKRCKYMLWVPTSIY